MLGRSIVDKAKMNGQKKEIEDSYNAKILKVCGKDIFNKKKEVWEEYLIANKKHDDSEENRFRGWIECFEWLLGEQVL